MGAYKRLNRQDSYITPYTARKQWRIEGNRLYSHGIRTGEGVSGSANLSENLLYRSIEHLYYSSFFEGVTKSLYQESPVDDSLTLSPETGILSFNQEDLTGTFTISEDGYLRYTEPIPETFRAFSLEEYIYVADFTEGTLYLSPDSGSVSYENYLQSSFEVSDSRILPYRFLNISIPRQLYGTHIEPRTFHLENVKPSSDSGSNLGGTIYDDGEGRLFSYYENSEEKKYVGNIIYTHGQVIIIDEEYIDWILEFEMQGYVRYNYWMEEYTEDTGTYFTLSFKANHPIFTYNYHCRVAAEEYNHTFNKTAYTVSSGQLQSNITGSSFQPYFTTVGLYNDANELIAVAKTSQPIPKSVDTDMTIIVKLDI